MAKHAHDATPLFLSLCTSWKKNQQIDANHTQEGITSLPARAHNGTYNTSQDVPPTTHHPNVLQSLKIIEVIVLTVMIVHGDTALWGSL
jgi:hypothetical protein